MEFEYLFNFLNNLSQFNLISSLPNLCCLILETLINSFNSPIFNTVSSSANLIKTKSLESVFLLVDFLALVPYHKAFLNKSKSDSNNKLG